MHARTFGSLFKKLRLQAGIATLKDFGNALADYGYVYEDSIFSHWQSGRKIPTRRDVLLTIIFIFKERNINLTIDELNALLASANQGYLTEPELQKIKKFPVMPSKGYSSKKIIEFLTNTGRSKTILRSGWIEKKIKNPESVAEHSFQLSILAMVLADELGVNKEKLIQMALLHDLCETVTGDIIWTRGAILDMKKRTEKEKLEKDGLEKIFKVLGKSQEYVKLFEEMLARATQEARIFWQLDKLEMAMQALEYEKTQKKNLDEFFINTDLQVHAPLLRKILKEIIKQRPHPK